MKNKKGLMIAGWIAGVALAFIGMVSGIRNLRGYGGVCIIAGSILQSGCLNRLQRISYEKEFPELAREQEIERRDERNTLIHSRAKAKSADFLHWTLLAAAALVFLGKGPLWPAGLLIGIFAIKCMIEWYYVYKYQKEM